jgi:hypothetical protein
MEHESYVFATAQRSNPSRLDYIFSTRSLTLFIHDTFQYRVIFTFTSNNHNWTLSFSFSDSRLMLFLVSPKQTSFKLTLKFYLKKAVNYESPCYLYVDLYVILPLPVRLTNILHTIFVRNHVDLRIVLLGFKAASLFMGDPIWGFRGNLVTSVSQVEMSKKGILNFEDVDITLLQKPGIEFSTGTKSCPRKNGTVSPAAVKPSKLSLCVSFLPSSDRCT